MKDVLRKRRMFFIIKAELKPLSIFWMKIRKNWPIRFFTVIRIFKICFCTEIFYIHNNIILSHFRQLVNEQFCKTTGKDSAYFPWFYTNHKLILVKCHDSGRAFWHLRGSCIVQIGRAYKMPQHPDGNQVCCGVCKAVIIQGMPRAPRWRAAYRHYS